MISTELEPYSQKKLLKYDLSFTSIIDLYNKKKLPNKILFSGPKGIGKSTFAYHLINYIFSKNEQNKYDIKNFKILDQNRSFKLILNKSHPNFHLIDIIDDKKVIEISQVREMIEYTNKSSFNNNERIVLIDNAENLNENSSNALLKVIEEPNHNVYFIIIFDSSKKILQTLKSRCIKFNFSLTFKDSVEITNKIINKNIFNLINEDLINYYNTPGDFINLINFSTSSDLNFSNISLKKFLIKMINDKYYKKNIYVKNNIFKFIELYLFKLINLNRSEKSLLITYQKLINKIYNLKKFNLDEESFFIDLKKSVLDG